jgi:hypothetical protein
MSYLSRNDLESIAIRVINDYKRLPRFQGQAIAHIDTEILACELCGLRLDDHFHLSRDGMTLGITSDGKADILVYGKDREPTIFFLDGATILVERNLRNDPVQKGRYNFTLAHETSHQILSRLFPESKRGARNRVVYNRGQVPRYPIQDWSEWQADCLASALLLPADLVLAVLQRFGFESGIPILNKVFYPEEYEKFCKIAQSLGASKQALVIRLKRLGLLGKEYLSDPYALVRVEKEEDEE